MDPLDFIPVADQHVGSTNEAERRTAVGRYYYAVFNRARILAEDAGRRVPKGADAHGCVRFYFDGAAKGVPDLKAFATQLGSMRVDRNTADYDMATPVDPKLAELAELRAKALIAVLNKVPAGRLRSALESVPTCPRPQPR